MIAAIAQNEHRYFAKDSPAAFQRERLALLDPAGRPAHDAAA
jgi:hypothetical protein